LQRQQQQLLLHSGSGSASGTWVRQLSAETSGVWRCMGAAARHWQTPVHMKRVDYVDMLWYRLFETMFSEALAPH
jgi:hypothetical protein